MTQLYDFNKLLEDILLAIHRLVSCQQLYKVVPRGERPSGFKHNLNTADKLLTKVRTLAKEATIFIEESDLWEIELRVTQVSALQTRLQRTVSFIKEKSIGETCTFRISEYNKRCRSSREDANRIQHIEAEMSRLDKLIVTHSKQIIKLCGQYNVAAEQINKSLKYDMSCYAADPMPELTLLLEE